jgi:class 3 adenylate cyclase
MAHTSTVTVLFTDLVGSTGLLHHGEARADQLRQAHFATVRTAAVHQGGGVIKSTGDGLMIVFHSAVSALAAALDAQRALLRLRRRDAQQPATRMGMATGEAFEEGGDWFGRPVIEAARLCALAHGDEVLTTGLTAAMVRGHTTERFRSRGEERLKGFDEPIEVMQVSWEVDTPVELPPWVPERRHFVGRSVELDRLREAWARRPTTGRHAVLVSGEPGIGKSSLVAELAREVWARGATVAWAGCDEHVPAAFQPFIEIIRQLIVLAPEAVGMTRNSIGSLARLLPELAIPVPEMTPPEPADPAVERRRVHQAVSALVDAAAPPALLIVLDDLQWADQSTLLLLRSLLLERSPAPLLVVGTYRQTDLRPDGPRAELMEELRDRAAVSLELDGLTQRDVETLVAVTAACPLDPAGVTFARDVHLATRGNPFFVGQILAHVHEQGAVQRNEGSWRPTMTVDELGLPAGARDLVRRRLAMLSPPARQVLTTGAVIGTCFDDSLIEQVSGIPTGAVDLLDALDEAVGAGLLAEVPDRPGQFVFVHGLVRSALLADLTSVRRASLHRRIGEALEQVGNAPPAVLAYHLCEGARPGETHAALRWSYEAIADSRSRLAVEEGRALAERALRVLGREPDPDRSARARLRMALAGTLSHTGEGPRSEELQALATEDARLSGDARLFAVAAVALATSGVSPGRSRPERLRLLEDALEQLPVEALALRAKVLSAIAQYRALDEGRGVDADEQAREAIELARASGDGEVLQWALETRMWALTGSPHLDLLHEVVAEYERLGADHAMVPSNSWNLGELDRTSRRESVVVGRAVVLLQSGDLAGFDASARELGALAAQGSGRAAGFCVMWRGMRALFDGDLVTAETTVEELAQHAAHVGGAAWLQRAHLLDLQDRLPELLTTARRRAAHTPRSLTAEAMLAYALARSGELGPAAATLTSVARGDLAGIPRDMRRPSTLVYLARTSAILHDAAAAIPLRAALAAYAGQFLVTGAGTLCLGPADDLLSLLDDVVPAAPRT